MMHTPRDALHELIVLAEWQASDANRLTFSGSDPIQPARWRIGAMTGAVFAATRLAAAIAVSRGALNPLDRLHRHHEPDMELSAGITLRYGEVSYGWTADIPGCLHLPKVLRVLGCLPLMDSAACSGGRRPRSLRGGNRGQKEVRRCGALELWGLESRGRRGGAWASRSWGEVRSVT